MFENLQRALRSLQNTKQLQIPILADADGYLDRECPASQCKFQFKVQEDDWANLVSDDKVVCPSCGATAGAKSWYTAAQVAAAKEYAIAHVKNQLNSAARADAEASKRNRRPNSFLSITLDYKGGPEVRLMPIAAAEPMRLRSTCVKCGCRHSFLGAAYFCPNCGANSAEDTFFQTLSAIRKSARLGSSLSQWLDRDDAEVMARALLEKAIQDTVMSFQRLAESLYENACGSSPRRNAFQNLDAGSEIWRQVFGGGYDTFVDAAALARLRMYFQQRHLVAHQQGIVDADYVSRSGDQSYLPGQRIMISEAAVLDFAAVVEGLGSALIHHCRSIGAGAGQT